MPDLRFQLLKQWLTSRLGSDFEITPIVGDASFRRYFRVFCRGETFIAADAPPDKENSHSFVAVASAFAAIKVNVPKIFACDLNEGFLLLSDFGDDLYQGTLTPENADTLYGRSLDQLFNIQRCQQVPDWNLPHFNADFIAQELANFCHWFLKQHLQLKLQRQTEKCLEQTFTTLIDSAINQPQCCIHRDYHSRNLLALPDSVGILDFQDAAFGPVTYDLVSLLRDCYIVWPLQDVTRWALSFYEKLTAEGFLTVSADVFLRWFDLMGVQRHLKAIFIFARKYHRDGVANYLPYITSGLRYVTDVIQHYPELGSFYHWMCDEVLPRDAKELAV